MWRFFIDNIYTIMSGPLQMVSKPMPDPDVGVCLAPQSHGIQRGRCVCMKGVCDVLHRIEENIPSAIYVEAPLNQVDAF